MTNKPGTFYTQLSKKGIDPKVVAEVGVYHPEASNIKDFMDKGFTCLLVEPDPASIKLIRKYIKDKPNVILQPVAVYDNNGRITLQQRGASTFVANLNKSPSLVNDNYKKTVEHSFDVACVTFDKIDPGNIDIISIDIEGCEWFVIKHMVSRPEVLCIETHGDAYKNPYLKEIQSWMSINGYQLWKMNKCDSIYLKGAVHNVSVIEKGILFFMKLWTTYIYSGETLLRILKLK